MKALVLAFALSASGCYATFGPDVYGYEVVYVDGVPVNVEAYPHIDYRGGTAYLIDDHWYYRYDGRWVYFVREPQPLWHYHYYPAYYPPRRYPPHYHHHHP